MKGRPAAVPHADLVRLFALFNAGRHAEMEHSAAGLARRYPTDGQGWKAWGIALMSQRKDALAVLRRAMALLPADVDVLSNLGGVLVARGELDEASECYRRALQIQPGFALAHSNLGDVLARQGHWQAAESSCRQALALQPALAAAHLNLGNALKGLGRLDEAIASYREALQRSPDLAESHTALGIALREQGLVEQAVVHLRQSALLRPGHASTHDQLGVALHATGESELAAESLRRALALQPRSAAAHYHLGNVLADLGRHEEAVLHYRDALASEPEHAEIQANLGVSLLALQQLAPAVAALRQAVALQPSLALTHSNLGNALMAQGLMHDAQASHEQAVALAPELGLVHRNLAHLLKTIGNPEAALAQLEQAAALDPEQPAVHSEVLFVRQYLAETPARSLAQLAGARRFGELALRRARPFASWSNEPLPERCLRIGLLSGDLRAHPVGYFVETVLAALAGRAADRLEIRVYANQREDDAVSQRLRQCCSHWLAVTDLDDAALADRIRSDGIDVLVDLSGHTLNNRLPMLACKPAPVQVSWLGYCGSTGLASVDAFIADPWIAPDGIDAEFIERVIRLPQTFLCFTPPPFDLAVGPLPALADGGIRFGCFNQLAKMNDAVVALWARVLRAVPGSRLLLQAQALQDPVIRAGVLARYAQHGIAPERLGLQPAQAREDYLAAYRQVDIALDPFPYPGGTTTLEALWMGVPVLTLPGASALSRQGLSILRNVGLAEWVAKDADDYLALAVRHAGDTPALAELRRSLRPRLLDSPLCDATRFASHFENALRVLWRAWCAREK
jgi:protein O-GlcNAc transferase